MIKGFTLIELSIVLVIIGLIVGGVLVGRDLIASAEIRAQIKQIEDITTAVNTFRDKYGAIPGDMPPSTASQLGFFTFTGTSAGSTCNAFLGQAFGNNDGIINSLQEVYPFWSHLGDAKLINGTYAGTAGSRLSTNTTGCQAAAGNPTGFPPLSFSEFSQFFPPAKLGLVNILALGNKYLAPGTQVYYNNTQKSNMFIIFTDPTVLTTASATVYQLYQMDLKIDDGFPTTGLVRDFGTTNSPTGAPVERAECTTVGANPIAYNLSDATVNTIKCTPAFLW